MSEPMSDERLAEIRDRADRYAKWPSPATHEWALQVGTRDLPDLLAEVERLAEQVKRVRDLHRRDCHVRQAVDRHPELIGKITCHMCQAIGLPTGRALLAQTTEAGS